MAWKIRSWLVALACGQALGATGCGVMMMMGEHPGMGCDGMRGARRSFTTDGEMIFRTGRNLDGLVLQDVDKSMMKMAHSCEMCHGVDGRGGMMMMGRTVPSIRFSDLGDPAKHRVPYTADLVRRFLDHELKSDGSSAQTGVVWKMSEINENDLIEFLKTL